MGRPSVKIIFSYNKDPIVKHSVETIYNTDAI